MTPVYSTEAYKGVVTSTGVFVSLYTVPTGKVFIVRDLDGYPQAAGAGSLFGGTNPGFWMSLPYAAQYAAVQWRGRQVLAAGEVFGVVVSTQPFTLAVSGYLLNA